MREKLRQNIHGVRGCEGCLEGGGMVAGWCGDWTAGTTRQGWDDRTAVASALRPRPRGRGHDNLKGNWIEQQSGWAAAPKQGAP